MQADILVYIAQPSKLLLSCCVPHVEAQGTHVCVEGEWVDLSSECGCILCKNDGEGYRARYIRTYFLSNSPVKWRLTKVVFPVEPSPIKTSLNVGAAGVPVPCASMMIDDMDVIRMLHKQF